MSHGPGWQHQICTAYAAVSAVYRAAADLRQCMLQESAEDCVYEYVVREDGAGWQNWRARVPAWAYPKDQERPKFAQLTIPTTESVRYEYLLSLVHAAGKVRPLQDILPISSRAV